MKISDVMRVLDTIEADLRGIESRLYILRRTLRDQIDPLRERTDLGYWNEDDQGTKR